MAIKSFQFLWGKDYWKREDNFFTRYIKAKSVDSACNKFAKSLPKTLEWIDYEVAEGDQFHDITENKLLQEYL